MTVCVCVCVPRRNWAPPSPIQPRSQQSRHNGRMLRRADSGREAKRWTGIITIPLPGQGVAPALSWIGEAGRHAGSDHPPPKGGKGGAVGGAGEEEGAMSHGACPYIVSHGGGRRTHVVGVG